MPKREPKNDGSGLVLDRDEAIRQLRQQSKKLAADPIDHDADALDRWASYWETWQAKQKTDSQELVEKNQLLQKGYGVSHYEAERRIGVVRYLLFIRGWPKWRIKRAAWVHWSVRNRTIERYIRRARDRVYKALDETREEMSARYVERLNDIIYAEDSKDCDVVKAVTQVARLLGLHKPIEVQTNDPEIAKTKEALRKTIISCNADPEARKALDVFMRYLRDAKDSVT